jgi:hypothetical protein
VRLLVLNVTEPGLNRSVQRGRNFSDVRDFQRDLHARVTPASGLRPIFPPAPTSRGGPTARRPGGRHEGRGARRERMGGLGSGVAGHPVQAARHRAYGGDRRRDDANIRSFAHFRMSYGNGHFLVAYLMLRK